MRLVIPDEVRDLTHQFREKLLQLAQEDKRVTLYRLKRLLILLVCLPLVLLPAYAIINPPITTVMALKLLGGAGIQKQWASIDDISPNLVRAVLVAEDGRFCTHHGIDWKEVGNALDERRRTMRGASTITMQLVKNLFLWTDRTWVRKVFEAPLALYAEFFLSKRRIMELYLNVIEWDTGVYGAQAAARHHFGTSAANLSLGQAARLAAILPNPAARNAVSPGPMTSAIAGKIAARASMSGEYTDCVLDR